MKIFKILNRALHDGTQRVGAIVLGLFGLATFIAVFVFIMNYLSWTVFKIAGPDSSITLKVFEEGLPSFWSFDYVGISLVVFVITLIAGGVIASIIDSIKNLIHYFQRISREIE